MMFVVNFCRFNSYMNINLFDFIIVCIVFLVVIFFVYYFNKYIKIVLLMYLILDGFLKINK